MIRPDIDEAIDKVSRVSLDLEAAKSQLLALLTEPGAPKLQSTTKNISRVFGVWANQGHVGVAFLPVIAGGKEGYRDASCNVKELKVVE